MRQREIRKFAYNVDMDKITPPKPITIRIPASADAAALQRAAAQLEADLRENFKQLFDLIVQLKEQSNA